MHFHTIHSLVVFMNGDYSPKTKEEKLIRNRALDTHRQVVRLNHTRWSANQHPVREMTDTIAKGDQG